MGRTGITEREVFEAADGLVAEGQKPTLKAMRERLGTGSPNTIHRLFCGWRESRPASSEATQSLPVGLVDAIRAELARTEARARSELEEELVEARREAEQLAAAGAGLEVELAEAREALEAVRQRCERLEGRCTEQAEAGQRQAVELEKARAELEAQRQRAEAAREHLEQERARAGALETARDEERAQVAKLAQANGVLEVERRALAERLEESRQEAKALGVELKKVQAAGAEIAQALAAERARVETLRTKLDTEESPVPAAVAGKGKSGTLHLPRKAG